MKKKWWIISLVLLLVIAVIISILFVYHRTNSEDRSEIFERKYDGAWGEIGAKVTYNYDNDIKIIRYKNYTFSSNIRETNKASIENKDILFIMTKEHKSNNVRKVITWTFGKAGRRSCDINLFSNDKKEYSFTINKKDIDITSSPLPKNGKLSDQQMHQLYGTSYKLLENEADSFYENGVKVINKVKHKI